MSKFSNGTYPWSGGAPTNDARCPDCGEPWLHHRSTPMDPRFQYGAVFAPCEHPACWACLGSNRCNYGTEPCTSCDDGGMKAEEISDRKNNPQRYGMFSL